MDHKSFLKMAVDRPGITPTAQVRSSPYVIMYGESQCAEITMSGETLFEQGLDQAFLVSEVVVDRGRRVAAALGQATDREVLATGLDEQVLGRVEDGPAGLSPLTLATGLGGSEIHWNGDIEI